MGCASSSPLVESGKNLVNTAKDSANEVVAKGEQTIHDTGEKMSTEMDHIKEAMQSAMHTAETSIGSIMGKTSNNIKSTTEQLEETANHIEAEVEDSINVASDAADEAVSQAETVIASEAETMKDSAESAQTEMFEKIDSAKERLKDEVVESKEIVENGLEVEDIEEHLDLLGDTVIIEKSKVEELVTKLPTPPSTPVKEPQKEERPPTLWEAAADAILHQKSFSASMDFKESEVTSHQENPRIVILECNEDIILIETELKEPSSDVSIHSTNNNNTEHK